MRELRIAIAVLGVLVVVCLAGGAYLMVKVLNTADDNAGLICAFGRAVTSAPIKQREGESVEDFRLRVEVARRFVRDLRELEDCPAQGPARILIDPDSQDALHGNQGGGGSQQTDNPPSQPPTPPEGGEQGGGNPPPGDGGGGGNPGTGPTPSAPAPPEESGLLNPVTENVPGLDCHIEVTALGLEVTVCN